MSEVIKNEGHILKAITKGCISDLLRAECYVLENGITIIMGRGYIRSLTTEEDDRKLSGQTMERMINSKDLQNIIPKDILEKLSNPIKFEKLNKEIAYGYEAKTLPRLAMALYEALLNKKIEVGHTYYKLAQKSGDVVKNFLEESIEDHIFNITGYKKIQDVEMLAQFFKNNFVNDLPSGHKRKFEEIGLFDAIYKIYNLKRNLEKPWQHPQFFGHIFNKYIYMPLDVILTNSKIQTKGIMQKLLKDKKTQGQTLYEFINEIGEIKFFGHLGTMVNIANQVNGKTAFEKMFYDFFPNCKLEKLQNIFPEQVFMLANQEIKSLPKKSKGNNDNKVEEYDLFSFPQNSPNFETAIDKIASTTKVKS